MTTFTPPRNDNEIRAGIPTQHAVSAGHTEAPVAPVVFLDPVTPQEAPEADHRPARDEDALRPLRTPFMTDATSQS
ncbi:hypothetical protein [Saccharopolyspora tripterygii]